jgi:hypothetical protein
MLYLIHGTDVKKIQDHTERIVESLKSKREFAQVFHIHADTFSLEDFEGITTSQGLFFDKHVFVARGLLQAKKEVKDYMLKNLESYTTSPHIYLFVEEDLDEKMVDAVSKLKDAKVQAYMGRTEIKEDISKKTFPAAHTYAEFLSIPKEKRTPAQKIRAWHSVDALRNADVAPEEFFGILWWKYKTIVQALGVTQKASGLTPFVYTQAKKLSDSYGERVKDDMGMLLDIYHESHMGECDMWEELEGLILR